MKAKRVKPEDGEKVLADALEQNIKSAGGSYFLTYRDIESMVPASHLHDCVDGLRRMRKNDRRTLIDCALLMLEKNYSRVVNGTASAEFAVEYAQTVMLWFANEVVEGRQTIGQH